MTVRVPRLLRFLGLACLLLATPVRADAPIEEVLVTGQQPGPGLWKLTRPGDEHGHVLWILGNYSPLPKKMQWRSREVEAVLARSQELLSPPGIDAKVGPLGGITLLPSLIGAKRNPGKAMLRETVPADLYGRWLPLKERYLRGDDDPEQWRPIFAAQALYLAALKQRGLVPYEGVWPDVERLARKARVRVITPELQVKVDKPRAAIREFKSMPLPDVECFARTIQRLESDMDLMRARANAWSVGDVETLRRLAPVARASACIGAVLESNLARERGYSDMPQRLKEAWVEAAELALARNASTLAVLPVEEILKPDGYVARLQARGYVVTEP
jgi:hypothetical protein